MIYKQIVSLYKTYRNIMPHIYSDTTFNETNYLLVSFIYVGCGF